MSNIDIKKWIRLWKALMCGSFLLTILQDHLSFVAGEGNIGCLFVEQLCVPNLEWCHDDFAFGKCLPHFETDPEQMYREPLTQEQIIVLKQMLQELHGAGLQWDHPFTQCRMQNAIYAMRNMINMERDACVNLAPPPIIPKFLDPTNPLAFVRFTQPVNDFSDEYLYPISKKSNGQTAPYSHHGMAAKDLNFVSPEQYELLQREFTVPRPEDIDDPKVEQEMIDILEGTNDLSNRVSDIKNRMELRRMLAEYEQQNRLVHSPVDETLFEETNDNFQSPQDYDDSQREQFPLFQRDFRRDGSYFKERESELMNSERLQKLLNDLRDDQNQVQPDDGSRSTFFREVAKSEHIPNAQHYQIDEEVSPNFFSGRNEHHRRMFDYEDTEANELPTVYLSPRDQLSSYRDSPDDGVYTEGGLIYVPGNSKNDATTNLLQSIMGFTRHERLDVKKPGPLAPKPQEPLESDDEPQKVDNRNLEQLPAHMKSEEQPKMKKQMHSNLDHANYSVDPEFAHVILKNSLDSWQDGQRIVAALEELLNLQNTFTHVRVDRHEVSFKVEPNIDKKTAADVAKSINDSRFKNNLSRRLGVIVKAAGVGDKVKNYEDEFNGARMEAIDEPNWTMIVYMMIILSSALAILMCFLLLLVYRRVSRRRDKLNNLQAGLSGVETSSKDYQDLCRARMAGKNDTSTARVASLSKENDRPPSSRSSTSSWSEEPALSNMDISTGHMVLSYMEDHLRNKGRLQREWEALCRYEAEPNAREAALQPECSAFNRIGAPLPFDHSRVVLNHLANAEGMDYINASTITDHDPRAPAYIAAQAPLQATLAHFWQMVWEQGCVVLVTLCRLQEGGESSCARYWPEEGAEVYHIYEVHLVSEHIWTDDYLVRSFYLKNLRTGETRTVTQFHFLSWPQAGVPISPKALLEFRRKVNKSYRGRSCPIIVHSSNGAGRAGAYILLDLVLGRMNKGAREIDIAATLEHLRDQRARLVETKQQFEFVLTAVAEEVHAILKALPQTQNEKRELEKETVKEQENQNEKPADKPANEN
ncbi:CLUMA_CG006471, isoform A [Clunio marinus]|uniref:CLUMA_CG006471, isoform A n=1 Tax=Clunio marinus TaxID=568069 RepID=A0A1J1HYG0_9DIPT|nr:CLUMA_CG006471, isoform A [Clunio marinus]